MTIPALFMWLVIIYFFGILLWFLPYSFLALGLFIWSLNKPANIILKVFAASPLLMTLLMIAETSLLSIDSPGTTSLASARAFTGFVDSNVLTIVATLTAGYICVGLGYGIYKIFQLLRIIKWETNVEPEGRIGEAV